MTRISLFWNEEEAPHSIKTKYITIWSNHITIRIGILRTYGPRDRRIKYCILVMVISKMNKLVAQIAC